MLIGSLLYVVLILNNVSLGTIKMYCSKAKTLVPDQTIYVISKMLSEIVR